jgi:hypothetical protein
MAERISASLTCKLKESYTKHSELVHKENVLTLSRERRLKANLMPGGITGPPCSWGI